MTAPSVIIKVPGKSWSKHFIHLARNNRYLRYYSDQPEVQQKWFEAFRGKTTVKIG